MSNMIPRLNVHQPLTADTRAFLNALQNTAFSGEVQSDYASRVVGATDNSIYQWTPQAIVYPKSSADVSVLMQLADHHEFEQIHFCARGGGSGTNGQSLTDGIVIDFSRHMNRILEINTKEGFARVQPGVILDQLNQQLQPLGYFFAPSLSPSGWATLGGMIATDASGEGSRRYGKTSDHVRQLTVVLADGSTLQSSVMNASQWQKAKQTQNPHAAIYQLLDHVLKRHKKEIQEKFPALTRFFSGYNLAKLFDSSTEMYSLPYLLCGSEGSLGLVTEATLRILPRPRFHFTLLCGYASFDSALEDTTRILTSDPTAIETIDETILELARGDVLSQALAPWLDPMMDLPLRSINLISFSGDDENELRNKIASIQKHLSNTNFALPAQVANTRTQLIEDPLAQEKFWALRKKGVGLLGAVKGRKKPVPFVEDTLVPPQHLRAYIAEFRALLDGHGLQYAMFGHADVGCLHVRPRLDMQEEEDRKKIRTLSEQVVALTKSYGGILWGEHGKGLRSEFIEPTFGPILTQAMREIKQVFDPHWRLNRGKIVSPSGASNSVLKIDQILTKGQYDQGIPQVWQEEYSSAIACNGNGMCLNQKQTEVMCPSAKVTSDRRHSPKGRAQLLREWLRQLSLFADSPVQKFQLLNDAYIPLPRLKRGLQLLLFPLRFFRRWRNTLRRNRGLSDYSQEVMLALDGCLACKACTTQCPVHVDIPTMKSLFLYRYHQRYLRHLKDWLIGNMESLLPLQSKFAERINQLIGQPLVQTYVLKSLGLNDLPELSDPSADTLIRQHFSNSYLQVPKDLDEETRAHSLILVQDAMTTFYDATLVTDLFLLLRFMGLKVFVAKFLPNGKPLYIKGYLPKFAVQAREQAAWLKELQAMQIPLVGIDPSVTLTYREEYPTLLANENWQVKVWLIQEWLVNHLHHFKHLKQTKLRNEKPYYLFSHCTEGTAHQDSAKHWQSVYAHFGLKLEIVPLGCCGMAGAFGMESQHYAESKGIYHLGWSQAIKTLKINRSQILVSGFSCRSQVNRFEGFWPFHPIQALSRELH